MFSLLSVFTFLNLRYLITVETSLGSQSSRLKMLHFRQLQEFLLEELPEFCPEFGPPELAMLPELPPTPITAASTARLRAELALRRRAQAGRSQPEPPGAALESGFGSKFDSD